MYTITNLFVAIALAVPFAILENYYLEMEIGAVITFIVMAIVLLFIFTKTGVKFSKEFSLFTALVSLLLEILYFVLKSWK